MLDIDPLQNYAARAASRILPVNNIVDNLTWTKGKHTITTGINFRFMTNNRDSYANSYPSYGFSTEVAVGLGEDIQNDMTAYLQENRQRQSAVSESGCRRHGHGHHAWLGELHAGHLQFRPERQCDRGGRSIGTRLPHESVRGVCEYSWRKRRR